MKANSLTKFAILFLATILASACGMPEATVGSNSQTKDPSTSSSSSSSGESKSSSSEKSSSNGSSSSSSGGGGDTPIIPSSYGVNPILKDYTLQSDNKTCDNHQPKEEIIWKASIVSKGVKRFKCPNCGGFTEQYYYDLDEVAFEDKTFAYDGNERTLTIEGIIPHDVTVRYTNNTATEITTTPQEAKAEFYNKENEKIGEKTANLSIVPNTGLPNLRINTTSGQDPDRKEKVNYTEMTASIDNCDSKWAVSRRNHPGEARRRHEHEFLHRASPFAPPPAGNGRVRPSESFGRTSMAAPSKLKTVNPRYPRLRAITI